MSFDLALSPGRRPTTMVRMNRVGEFLCLLSRSDYRHFSKFGTLALLPSCSGSILRFLRLVLLLLSCVSFLKALAAIVYYVIDFWLCLPIFRYTFSQSCCFCSFRLTEQHLILTVHNYQTRDLGRQIGLRPENAWGIVRAVLDLLEDKPDGR